MAGRARTRALQEELQRRAVLVLSQGEDHAPTMLDYVADRIESGETIKELALDLTDTLGDVVTYARIMAVLRAEHGDDAVEARLDASRKRASHCLAEDALAIVDQEVDSNVDVARAASRARTRQWLAEKWNRQQYGQDKGVSLHITTGSLHLDALRAAPASLPAVTTPAPSVTLTPTTEDAQDVVIQRDSDT